MTTLRDWVPSPDASEEDAGIALSSDERRVLAQLDGSTSVADLPRRTALPIEHVVTVLRSLLARGVVSSSNAPPELARVSPSHAESPFPLSARGQEQELSGRPRAPRPRSSPVADTQSLSARDGSGAAAGTDIDLLPELLPADDADAPDLESLPELLPADDADDPDLESLPELLPADDAADLDLESLPELLPADDAADLDLESLPELLAADDATDLELESLPELPVADESEGQGVNGDDLSALDELVPTSEAPGSEPDGAEIETIASYRQLFETTLHHLPVDLRIARAHTTKGEELLALCFDPMPGVVEAVLENQEADLLHARLIAEHHRNPIGLDTLVRRTEIAHDATVRRLLLRNQQSSERLLIRLLAPLPMAQVFRSNMGHELTDRARKVAREVLRQKFLRCTAEERVSLIFQTEGRCLPLMIGATFDQKTTALLMRRTYQSTMVIQSLARFAATPPAVISHLLHQQVVKRSPHLKKLLQQHSNCPKLLKR